MQTSSVSTSQSSDAQSAIDRLNAPSTLTRQSAAASLGQADFLRLLTTQLSNQDPLEPVSNEEMLAQMAQFSSLEAQTASSATLDDISSKLDSLIAAQEASAQAANAAAEAARMAAEKAAQAAATLNPDAPETATLA